MMRPRRRAVAWLAVSLACATPLAAVAQQPQQEVSTAPAAELRGLDRMSGELTDLHVEVGSSVRLDRLIVSLVECRYPADNPSGDAFAYLLIQDTETQEMAFEGWMVASSPALNSLDHMRYDVWVVGCSTS